MSLANHSSDHASHDLHLIASAADRDADATTRAAADRQAASCAECAELLTDLRSIASSLGELPRAIPIPATRDFRISPEQADRLRRWSGLRRLLRPFGAGAAPSLRPLAAAFTTIGIAGLLFTVLLPGFLNVGTGGASPAAAPAGIGAAASEPTTDKNLSGGPTAGPQEAGPTAAPAELPGAGGASPEPARSSASADFGSTHTQSPTEAVQPAPAPLPVEPEPSPWLPVTVFSLALLAAGVVLLGLLVLANRLR